jgi:predicted ATP-dependent Lon-type protease
MCSLVLSEILIWKKCLFRSLEQGGGKLIPEGIGKPGHVYTVANGTNGMMGLFKFESYDDKWQRKI